MRSFRSRKNSGSGEQPVEAMPVKAVSSGSAMPGVASGAEAFPLRVKPAQTAPPLLTTTTTASAVGSPSRSRSSWEQKRPAFAAEPDARLLSAPLADTALAFNRSTRPSSLSESSNSSLQSLLARPAAARRTSLHSRGEAGTSSKLQKRRPGSAIQQHELDTYHIIPEPPLPLLTAGLEMGSPQVLTSSPLVLDPPVQLPLPPDGPSHSAVAESPINQQISLIRNASQSSQSGSSEYAPGTDESAILQTPNDAPSLPLERYHDRWALAARSPARLSRMSTRSYQVGDDTSIPYDNGLSLKVKLEALTLVSDSAVSSGHLSSSDDEGMLSVQTGAQGSPSQSTVCTSSTLRRRSTYAVASNTGSHSPSAPLSRNASDSELTTVTFRARPPSSSHTVVRQSVAFELPDDASETGTMETLRRPRPTRTGIAGNRASSLGGVSVNTTSVYSVGEVAVATRGTLAVAQTVQISPTKQRIHPAPSVPIRAATLPSSSSADPAQNMLRRMKDSSNDIRQAMDSEVSLDSRIAAFRRRAPPPPRLSENFSTRLARQGGRSTTAASPIASRPALPGIPLVQTRTTPTEQSKPERPKLAHRSNSLGKLWRKLSAGPSRQEKTSDASREQPAHYNLRRLQTPRDHESDSIPVPPIPEQSSLRIRPAVHAGQTTAPNYARRPWRTSKEMLPVQADPDTAQYLRQASDFSPRRPEIAPALASEDASKPAPVRLSPASMLSPPRSGTSTPGTGSCTPEVASDMEETSIEPLSGLAGVRKHNLQVSEEIRSRKTRLYRQTLFEIADDTVFQQVLEDLTRLDHAHAWSPGSRAGLPTPPPLSRTPSAELLDKLARQQSIKAWFVTREIVKGERGYGRLLAKGVAITKDACERSFTTDQRSSQYSSPVRQGSSKSSLSTLADDYSPSRSGALRLRRDKGDRTKRNSEYSLGPPPAQLSSGGRPPAESSLSLLAERLPRLLALSLALSARFEADLSPLGVAAAFSAMEEELTTEFARWASEIGGLVSSGKALEVLGFQGARSGPSYVPNRHHRSNSMGAGGESQEDRLGFSDIVIMPIQRASRYRLLFQELASKADEAGPVADALAAAQRLVQVCNENQTYDLEALRRPVSTSGKKRPKSIGPRSVEGI